MAIFSWWRKPAQLANETEDQMDRMFMFKCTVWTDFDVPSSNLFLTEASARAHGEQAVQNLGCARYTIAPDRPIAWRPASKLTIRNYKQGAPK